MATVSGNGDERERDGEEGSVLISSCFLHALYATATQIKFIHIEYEVCLASTTCVAWRGAAVGAMD